MKKILFAIFILLIGITLYSVSDKESSTSWEDNIITNLTNRELVVQKKKNNIIEENNGIKKDNSIKAEVSKVETSKETIHIAKKNEIQYYNEQMEILKNRNYLDKEAPIYQDNNQIFLNLDGEHKQISLGKDEYFRPNLSSDKSYLSYEDSNGIVIQNITDGSIKKFGDDASDVSWHPNRALIVYLRTKDDGTNLTESKIYTYNIENKKETLLRGTGERIVVNPIFSEDGSSIYVKDDETEEIIILTVKKNN